MSIKFHFSSRFAWWAIKRKIKSKLPHFTFVLWFNCIEVKWLWFLACLVECLLGSKLLLHTRLLIKAKCLNYRSLWRVQKYRNCKLYFKSFIVGRAAVSGIIMGEAELCRGIVMRYFTIYKCDTKLSCHCFLRGAVYNIMPFYLKRASSSTFPNLVLFGSSNNSQTNFLSLAKLLGPNGSSFSFSSSSAGR